MRKRGAFTVGQINESTKKGRKEKKINLNELWTSFSLVHWMEIAQFETIFIKHLFPSLVTSSFAFPPQTQNKSRQDSSISCVGWLWIRKGDSLLCLLRYALIVDKEVSSTIEKRTRDGEKATVSTITMCGGVLTNCDVIWNDNWMVILLRKDCSWLTS